MDSDFAEKLRVAMGGDHGGIVIPAEGAACPRNFKGTIQEAFNKYIADYAGKDFVDPRGMAVTLNEDNFPKLLKLRYRPRPNGPCQRARAKAVLQPLKDGTFDESKHYSEQPVRLRTLFWIEEIICRPDGIYPNCAKLVEGEEVYFKRYRRDGPSDTKLVFTAIGHAGQRIVITSFLDSAHSLANYCDLPALWSPEK